MEGLTTYAPGKKAALPMRMSGLFPTLATVTLFVLLFAVPAATLAADWWTDPEAGHGLLLAPAAFWLAWKSGWRSDQQGNPALGLTVLALAVLLRIAAELGAEMFTFRASMIGAMAGLVIYHLGFKQLLAWWLPFLLLVLSIPLPELVRSAIALPLQFRASEMGANLLEWRHVPVQLTGNIIYLPGGHRLFVTEACSGLRSLTALLSLAVLIGGIWFRTPVARVLLVALAVPIAVAINGVRVFLTGFLVFFVDPALGDGFMHLTEGWLLFVVSLGLIAAVAAALAVLERRLRPEEARDQ